MSLRLHFPFVEEFLDPADANMLERSFEEACLGAGITTDAPESHSIGIDLISQFISGWTSSQSKNNWRDSSSMNGQPDIE